MTIHDLLAHPAMIQSLKREELVRGMAELESLQQQLNRARTDLMLHLFLTPVPMDPLNDILSVDEAAKLINCNPRWFWKHADELPFCQRVSKKVMRISRHGLLEWIKTKSTRI
jgi:hypothetical protein